MRYDRIPVLALLAALSLGAAQAQQPSEPAKPAPPAQVDSRIIEDIFGCFARGLPRDWKKAWIVVTSVGSYDTYLAEFFVATAPEDGKGAPLEATCPASVFSEYIRALNDYLTPAQRRWRTARISFTREGAFETKYEYR